MEMNLFNLTLDIKFCHISYHDKEWVERKTKCDYTIWNIISGSLALEINGITIKAAKGDVLLFHPGDTYKAWCSGDDHCYFLVTFFSICAGSNINLLTSTSTAGLYSNNYVHNISNKLCTEYQQRFINLKTPNLCLYASFLTFFADLSTQFGLQTPFHVEKKSTPDFKLQVLLDYIDENINRNLSVKELAEYIDMSEKYFSSFFHLHIGMSPKQYITKCRMTHALTLLSNPKYSLQDISNILCYADQYSFAKAFKNYYGEAPGKFRNTLIYVPPQAH